MTYQYALKIPERSAEPPEPPRCPEPPFVKNTTLQCVVLVRSSCNTPHEEDDAIDIAQEHLDFQDGKGTWIFADAKSDGFMHTEVTFTHI